MSRSVVVSVRLILLELEVFCRSCLCLRRLVGAGVSVGWVRVLYDGPFVAKGPSMYVRWPRLMCRRIDAVRDGAHELFGLVDMRVCDDAHVHSWSEADKLMCTKLDVTAHADAFALAGVEAAVEVDGRTCSRAGCVHGWSAEWSIFESVFSHRSPLSSAPPVTSLTRTETREAESMVWGATVGERRRLSVPNARHLSQSDVVWIDANNEATRMQYFDCVTAIGTWRESGVRQRQIGWMRRACPQAVARNAPCSLQIVEVTGCEAEPYFGRLDPTRVPVFADRGTPSSNLLCMLAFATARDALDRVLRQEPCHGMPIEFRFRGWDGQRFAYSGVFTRRAASVDFEAEPAVSVVVGSHREMFFAWAPVFQVLDRAAHLLLLLTRTRWPWSPQELRCARVRWTLGPTGGWRTTLLMEAAG